jgi:hypothetical protein
MIRKPAVAGYFYPKRAEELRAMLKEMIDPKRKKEKALAVVSPHAGFIYSGYVAGAVFSSVSLPEHYVILGPSHRGMRSLFAIMKKGEWQTPLGDVPLEASLAQAILKRSSLIEEEESAHVQEHSLEVQLPFIQYLRQDFSIVPICISPMADYRELEELARAIAGGIREFGQDVLIVASTDMSHYVSQEVAKRKDSLAIEKVLALDAQGLFEVVQEENISMCGFQPTTAAILAAKELGAKKAELIRYQTSGDASGNYDEVVGYAGLRIA